MLHRLVDGILFSCQIYKPEHSFHVCVDVQCLHERNLSLTATFTGLWDAHRWTCDVDSKSSLFTWAGWPEAGRAAWLPYFHCVCALSALSVWISGSRCKHTGTTQRQFPLTQQQCVLFTLNGSLTRRVQVLVEMATRFKAAVCRHCDSNLKVRQNLVYTIYNIGPVKATVTRVKRARISLK